MLRAQRTHKSLFNDLCKRSLIPPFSSCFYFIRTFALKAHPSDGAKVRVPEPDDKTDWIRPNFSEYFQIRKRIRQESDDQFRRSYLRKIEDATMRGMEQISLKKENSETHFDRKSTFGEDQFGDKKTFRMAKELKGMSANAIPDKTMRQIRTLLPFLDAEDEHDYVFRMNRAASAAVFRDEATRTALNEEMVTRNKLLIGKFDEHSKRLAHEAEQIKRELSKDESAIERASVQSALYKWFCLKIDFSSDELTTGAVTETEKELSGQQRKSDKTAIESDPLPFDVKGSGSGDGSEYAETKEKVFREIKELSKGNFTLEEARDLLSEESVLALVDGMRTCLNTAHDLLIVSNCNFS
ncbi:hypothetical protein MHBO_000855 [Bonamia ostreae]|uniref:Uncharacterized protein n=1 Tax=Bonamia ostreae TaxID=126728 RepID=A0ABV2AH16_9EUKA